VVGRALMYFPFLPPAWLAGVVSLGVSKILDKAEIGHNVLHGQYDWMGEPDLNSREYKWNHVAPPAHWKNSHNYEHHTFTNIVGKDRDRGYGILRVDRDQEWHPYYLLNPLIAFTLMLTHEWSIGLYALEVENVVKGKRKWSELAETRKEVWDYAKP